MRKKKFEEAERVAEQRKKELDEATAATKAVREDQKLNQILKDEKEASEELKTARIQLVDDLKDTDTTIKAGAEKKLKELEDNLSRLQKLHTDRVEEIVKKTKEATNTAENAKVNP